MTLHPVRSPSLAVTLKERRHLSNACLCALVTVLLVATKKHTGQEITLGGLLKQTTRASIAYVTG